MGRPKKEIDYEIVERLAHIFCTKEEIACILGVDPSTLYADKIFQDTYKKGREGGKMSLRRMQMKLAEKNTAMAVWLGKQYLGQRDLVNNETAPSICVVSDVPTNDDGEPLGLDAPHLDAYANVIDATLEETAKVVGVDLETMNDGRK